MMMMMMMLMPLNITGPPVGQEPLGHHNGAIMMMMLMMLMPLSITGPLASQQSELQSAKCNLQNYVCKQKQQQM